MKQVYYKNSEFKEILAILEEQINKMEELPYPKARELTTSILQHLDLVHREAFTRMCQYLEKNAPDHYLKIRGDYTVNVLMKLYDIIEDQEEDYDKSIVGFVPEDNLGLLTPIIKWERLGSIEDIQPRKLYKDTIRGNKLIYSLIDDKIFAIKNECLDSALPLDTGEFKEDMIICPWHGCRYDIKSGKMVDNMKVQQQTYETRINDSGEIEIKVPVSDKEFKK
jgi:nitrite reductase/ring-hydroxylating ferredoxin subunit